MKSAVFNASPLIILARAGYLELVPGLFCSSVVPQAVVNEIAAGASDDPARMLLGQLPWLQVVAAEKTITPLATWRLGSGETEVLEYARLHPGVVAILDDRAARRAARTLAIPLSRTLGILAAAARAGAVPSLDQAIGAVRRAGLYVDPVTLADLKEVEGNRP